MAPKRTRATPNKEVVCSEHHFVLLSEHRAAQQCYMKLVRRGILAGRTVDFVAVWTLRVEEDVRRLLQLHHIVVLQLHHIVGSSSL